VLILRIRRPDIRRSFRTPAIWIIAPLGVLFSLFLIIGWPWAANGGGVTLIGGLPSITIWRFVIWMAIGLLIYFGYGIRKSALARGP
jgi:APA family basic amino acid/polyamine antiporter